MDARPISLHQRILADISERIVSGDWPPGHRIPFEHELSAEYHCSRMTVNKALSQLAKSGLIERRRRSGSFVTRPRSQAAILEIHDIKHGGAGARPALSLRARRARRSAGRRPSTAQRLDVAAGASVVELSCRHFAGKKPFCLEERLISLAAVPEAADESFAEIAPGPWLIGRVPWSAAEHTIRATAAGAATAAALDIAAGSPCLVVERRTWSADLPVTLVTLTYAGDSHALVARFAPS